MKKERKILFLVFSLCSLLFAGNFADAQVPGDFNIPCQICDKINNDVLNCNNKEVAPYVDFTWTQSPGATKYEIYRKGTSTGAWSATPIATITNLNSLRYSANVTLNSQNHYYIRAVNGNTGEYKSCSFYSPNYGYGGNGCMTNVPYASSDDAAEANCELPPASPPTCTVSFSPATITSGGYTTQSWTSSNDADGVLSYSCAGNLGTGTLPASGSRGVIPTGTQRCTFTAKNTAGTSVTCSATVTVNTAPTPTPTPTLGPPTPTPDVGRPVISNVKIINITTVSATVTWDTDEPADSQVEFCTGFTRCGNNTPLAAQLVTSHTVNLSNLTPSTNYAVWVKSKDGVGNLATMGYFLFTTLTSGTPRPSPTPSQPPTPLPVISNIQVSNITRNSALVTWDTDKPSDSSVGMCYFGNFCLFFFYRDRNLVTRHSVMMDRLTAGTRYDIKVRSGGALGKASVSGLLFFTTSPKLEILNPRVSNITSTTATVTWNTNYPADSRVKLCLVPYFCWGIAEVYDPNSAVNHTMQLTGLSPNTGYYYQITSKDSGDSVKSGYLNFRSGP